MLLPPEVPLLWVTEDTAHVGQRRPLERLILIPPLRQPLEHFLIFIFIFSRFFQCFSIFQYGAQKSELKFRTKIKNVTKSHVSNVPAAESSRTTVLLLPREVSFALCLLIQSGEELAHE